MEGRFDFGMIGIGVMGSNLLLNMAEHGFSVIGFDLKQERADQLEQSALEGMILKGTTDIGTFISSLKKPRKIMMLVPAGKPVDQVIENLLPHLEKDDIVIDGGNSHFRDTNKRIQYLQGQGIHFFGMGVSGGEMGARLGPSLMPGGDRKAWEYLRPVLEAIAAKVDNRPCVAYMGNNAAGHYVKMVHNGIEYAMMQLISEVYDLLRRSGRLSNKQLHELFSQWNQGQLSSFLISVTAEIFRTADNETQEPDDYLIDKILDQAGSKGTGKWTSQEAMDLPVAIPTIDMAVSMRDLSVYKEQRTQAARLYAAEVKALPVDNDLINAIENTLAFCFTLAYAQGLAMLAKASEVHQMQIPLPDVVNVWKGGCIIRSVLLGNFSEAYREDAALPNLLLDKTIATLLAQREESARRIISLAQSGGIPVAGMSSALAYYDAFRSERLPVNLIQAQRDFFGAHTYRRIDKEGVFHTEWNTDTNL